MQLYKWEQENKQILKIELIIFTMILSILLILMRGYSKLIKNHTKTLIFTILDMSRSKKLVIV